MATRHIAVLAAWLLAMLPWGAAATVVLSGGPASPLPTEIGARARWGGSGFEAVMLDSGTQVAGTSLNPTGSPVWQLGQPHRFRLFWDWTAGALTWQLDFNRDNSFGAGESASFTTPARAGSSFGFILLTLNSRTVGINSNAIDITNLSINGAGLGNFTADSLSPTVGQFFAPGPSGPRFRSIEILGEIIFRSTGGNGAFQGERPRMQIDFLGSEPVPEPASWVLLVTGFGTTGLILRRRRQPAVAA